jgi:antagonist of KipI
MPGRLRILRPGLLTTVQDLGRWGFQRWGVPVAGAMDAFALCCANRLVGNPDRTAALEITVTGPELSFEGPAVIALTGGDFSASLDGAAIPGWTAVAVGAGGTLTCGERRLGARAYLAVAGGVDVPPHLGSRATHVRSATGGLGGRALRSGDQLLVGRPALPAREVIGRSVPLPERPAYSPNPHLRVVLGPQAEVFPSVTLETLTGEPYLVTSESDRMGYRLAGPSLSHAGTTDLVSDATPLGAIQVLPNGQPVLLMADRQPTGGYAKPAVVIAADLPLAAQLLPGDTLGFRLINVAEARRILFEQRRRLDEALPPVGS